jgi:hypothetical protein
MKTRKSRLGAVMIMLIVMVCLQFRTRPFGKLINNGGMAAAQETGKRGSDVPDAGAIAVSDLLDPDALVLVPGQSKHIILPVKAIGGYMSSATIVVKPEKSDAPFMISHVLLSEKGNGTPYYAVSNYGNTYVEFDVRTNEIAKIGNYPITVAVTAINADTGNSYTNTLQLNLQVLKELEPPQITISEVSVKDAMIGSDTEIKFYVKNEGEITARNTYLSLKYGDTNIAPKYTTPKMKLGDMAPGKAEYMTLPVRVLPTATEGQKTITVNSEYKNADGTAGTDSRDIYVMVKKNEDDEDILVKNVSYNSKLAPGAKANMILALKNNSSQYFQDVTVKIDDSAAGYAAEGIIKNYYGDGIWAGYMGKGEKLKVKIPMIVSKQATGGLKTVNLIISYVDKKEAKHVIKTKVYPDIIGGSGDNTKSNIVISHVSQSPAQPVAGENMEVSFDIQNKNKVEITDLKIKLNELTGSTFIPVRSDPYIYVAKLAAGAKRRIIIPLIVSESIPEGLNNLAVQYSYANNASGDTATIPVHDIKNDLGSNSKPKLIIRYKTRPKELRAGSTFDFNFELYNTHPSIAAKNITVTFTQADNIITVAQGANNMFIKKISPEKGVKNTLKFKVKSDASTKAYPLKATIEYEYPGMKANPTTGIMGETTTIDLNLMVVENSRPDINYVDVSSWDGPVVKDNPATIYFEFYNMGKSKLNNVIATVEGDFKKTEGDMQFIGNVEAGASSPVEFEAIPTKEGKAKGTLRISFEDSNGDKIHYKKEFEAMVEGTQKMSSRNKGMQQAMKRMKAQVKKPILPVWAFVIIQIAILAIVIPVTRAILIKAYKSKLRISDQEDY